MLPACTAMAQLLCISVRVTVPRPQPLPLMAIQWRSSSAGNEKSRRAHETSSRRIGRARMPAGRYTRYTAAARDQLDV